VSGGAEDDGFHSKSV